MEYLIEVVLTARARLQRLKLALDPSKSMIVNQCLLRILPFGQYPLTRPEHLWPMPPEFYHDMVTAFGDVGFHRADRI